MPIKDSKLTAPTTKRKSRKLTKLICESGAKKYAFIFHNFGTTPISLKIKE